MARVYDEFLRQRLSRRRLLQSAGGAAVGVAGITLLGCTDGGGKKTGTGGYTPDSNETPTLDGILRLRQANAFPSLSPVGVTALASTLTFGFTTYDHLWYVPIDTGNVEKMLAEEIEIVDPDALQLNIKLKDAVFHDKEPVNGRKVVADDVVASWELFRDDPFGLGRDWLHTIMESLTADGDDTLIIKQKRKYAWVYGTAAAGSPASSSVLPRETITADFIKNLDTDIIGSGRFFLESQQGGQNIKLRRFQNWRVPGEPFLGGVDLVFIPDFTSYQAQFKAGNVDQLDFQNKLQADQMQGELGDKMTVTSDLSRAYHSLLIKAVPPFDDPRVRKALRLAINRQEMIQLVERDAEGGVVAGIVPPAQPLYALPEDDDDMKEYIRYDVDEAKSLLEDANFDTDKEYTLLISSPNEELADRAQVLKDQFSKVGVKLRIEAQDLLSVWVPRVLLQADYELTLFTHLAYEDPYLPLSFYTNFAPVGPTGDPRGRNWMLYFDDDISKAVDDTSLELEDDARIAKVEAAQRLIMSKDAPMINIYSGVSFTGRRSWYKGWITGRGSFGLFNGRAWIDTAARRS